LQKRKHFQKESILLWEKLRKKAHSGIILGKCQDDLRKMVTIVRSVCTL